MASSTPAVSAKHNLVPLAISFHPRWWNRRVGIQFDRDHFYHSARRVEDERRMEQALYDRWGAWGLGPDRGKNIPWIGSVHLAAGYLVSEILGCSVDYSEDDPPTVHCANHTELSLSGIDPFLHRSWLDVEHLMEELKRTSGYVRGDINWQGVLNVALDLRGETLLLEILDKPPEVERFFQEIAAVIEEFVLRISGETGTSSISVNRMITQLQPSVHLHSECSNVMISEEVYERFLLPIDRKWGKTLSPFGIHHCGGDAHRFAHSYAKVADLTFLDLGWGGKVDVIREALPNTFLNLRLDPVHINSYSDDGLYELLSHMLTQSGDIGRTGFCCINMGPEVLDTTIDRLFRIVDQLRKECDSEG